MATQQQSPRSRETQAIVWLDREEASVFQVYPTDQAEVVVRGKPQACIKHLPGVTGHATDEHYYHEVTHALARARRILVVGPGSAKLSLVRHMLHHDQDMEPRVVGLETVAHVGDEQLVSYAREYLE